MRQHLTRTLTILAATTALAAPVFATTVNNTFSFSGEESLFGPGALGFNASASTDIGFATIGIGAQASTGNVDAFATANISSTFDDEVEINTNTAVTVALNSVVGSFNTFLGASAGLTLDFDPINVAGISINPPPITVGPNYSLSTDGSTSGLGRSGTDSDERALAGVGVPTIPGVSVTAETGLNASQNSSFTLDNVFGLVEAVNTTSGERLTDAFSFGGSLNDGAGSFNFGTEGLWDLSLIGVGIGNSFDADFGLTASYTVGFGIGVSCGDPTDDDDNFLCAFETGASGSTNQLTLLNGTPFGIDWGTQTASLGSINVVDSSLTVVPLPATLPMMLAGLGGFMALRRRQKTKET